MVNCSKTKQNKQWKPRFRQIDSKIFQSLWRPYFFKFPAARAQEYTDLEKFFTESGTNTETYRSCLAKGEHLVCKINHDQVSAEQKLGFTKVRPDLFLILINPIAPKLTVPNGTVVPGTLKS